MSPSTAPSDGPAERPGAGRVAIVLGLLAAYAVFSHWLMTHAADRPWAVAVVFGPLVGAVALTGWQKRQPALLLACAAGVAVLALVVARGGVQSVNRMYLLQHVAIHAALGVAFFSTLRGGEPLITTLARGVHQRLNIRFTDEMALYTRSVTALWAGYFFVMVLLSLALYALAPWSWWSLFANVGSPLSVGLLMVGEHIQRYRLHPNFERVSLMAAINAYRHSGPSGPPEEQGTRP